MCPRHASPFKVRYLIATDEWLSVHDSVSDCGSVIAASHRDLERMSDLKCAPDVIAVYDIPEHSLDIPSLTGRLVLALDSVQDPGNLGTIIRTADWFGVRDIICSRTTADLYNPKSYRPPWAPFPASGSIIQTSNRR